MKFTQTSVSFKMRDFDVIKRLIHI